MPPTAILHRQLHAPAVITVAIVLFALACSGLAQARRQKRNRGPRALAVLEVAPNGRTQLVPITILDDGKFYDASVYRADPRPMALDDGVVYEGERTGESLGLFTVTDAKQVKGIWFGLGKWHPNSPPEPVKTPSEPALKPPTGDDRPVLRRPKSEQASPETSPTGQAAAEVKPAPEPPPDESSGRPRLRRGKPAAQDTEEVTIPPLTRRGAAAETQAQAPPPQKPATAAAPALPSGTRFLAAISDADGPEPRPFSYDVTAGQRQQYTQELASLAYVAVARFASTRPAHKPAGAASLTPTDVRVFDLQHNNEPVWVFTGRVPELSPSARGGSNAAQNDYWVTIVAQVDMYNQLRQLFAYVTDNSHLDVYPRMELIDAVDADGNKAGELLFREIFDSGDAFALYRVGMDKLFKLFEGAGSVTQ